MIQASGGDMTSGSDMTNSNTAPEAGNEGAVLMLVNCSSDDEAERIAEELLNRSLAAAVQIVGPARSYYRWQGTVRREKEWLVIIKTAARSKATVSEVVRQLHGYALPGILSIAVDGGEPRYLRWLLQHSVPD